MMHAALPPVFVINLKRSPERRVSMAARLDPLHIPYSFFDGVDGGNLDLAVLPAYDGVRRRRYFGRDLRKGEVGCLLSHRAVYQHMVDNNIEAAVVLEDDTFLTPEFPAIVRALMQHPVGWDVVRFLDGDKVYKKSRILGALTGSYKLARPLIASGGAYGYMLTLKAAKEFVRQMQTNYVPIDTVHSYVWKTGLETFNVVPSPVSPDREISSTIGEQRFDKTLNITGLQKLTYPFTRFWLKISELIGKKRAYWLSWPRDLSLKCQSRKPSLTTVTGIVCAGRGMGAKTAHASAERLKSILGAEAFPGTLNVVTEEPIILKGGSQLDKKAKQFLVPLYIGNTQCFVHHWSGRPMHVAELFATSALRQSLGLADGQKVEMTFLTRHVARPPLWRRLVWQAFYRGRLTAYYDDNFLKRIKPFKILYKALCQKKTA